MNKVLTIVGPTGVGKTELSLQLARRFQGEIVSGDAIQVFRGLDIGSGKVTAAERAGLAHHHLDILDPKERISVADFQQSARRDIDQILSRGHLPMLVGGTGLYIKAVLYDYTFLPQDPRHQQLTRELEQWPAEQLAERLRQRDPQAASQIHPHNRRRLIRALVIAELSSQSKSELEAQQKHEMVYDAFILGLTLPREQLRERIERRVDAMLANGLQDEVAGLLRQGVTFEDQSMQGIGYKEWRGFFEGQQTREQVREQILIHTRQFARRQMTWFTHQTPVRWLDVSDASQKQQVISEVENWLKEESCSKPCGKESIF